MTGIRSPACLNCYRRKVKCDESRPACKRCIKSGLQCEGYQKLVVFVDGRKRPGRDLARSQAQTQDLEKVGQQRPAKTFTDSQLSLSVTSRSDFPPQMPATAFKRDILISFMLDKLHDPAGRNEYKRGSWWVLQAIDQPTADTAMLALVTAFFGRASRHTSLIQEGVGHYAKALSSLRSDLQGPAAYSLGILAATSTLSMYELIAFSSSEGWINHAGGLARLMQVRGPWRHKSGVERKALIENRSLLISQAIIARKRTFLAERAWKEVPWEGDPRDKDPFDFLNDIGCDIAGVLFDLDSLPSTTGSKAAFDRLLQTVKETFERLDAWWRAWATKHLDDCSEVFPSAELGISFDEMGPVFETVLHFDSFSTCYVTTCYNAMRIILLQTLQKLSASSLFGDPDQTFPYEEDNPTPMLGISSDIKGLTLEILRSLEFCESLSKRFLGTFCLLFPLYYAQRSLEMDSREARWLRFLPRRNFAHFRGSKDGANIMEVTPTCGSWMLTEKLISRYEIPV